MTQEEKQLLLKDLSARLPYGVKGLHRGKIHELFTIDSREANNACIQVDRYNAWFSVDTFKPYLRPLSSMTEEEKAFVYNGHIEFWIREDYCNKHHLDYRGLIPMSLALEAPEGMY